jgi:TolB protein
VSHRPTSERQMSHQHHRRRLACMATASLAALALASASAAPAARPGERIVFHRLDPAIGKNRLYTIRPDGSGVRAITSPGPDEDRDSFPDWSPDGRSIAFTRFFPEQTDLLLVRPDGTGVRNLTRAGCTRDCLSSESPAWSPDGQRIAFERAIGPRPDGPPRLVGIFVVDADGSNVRQLTQFEPNSGSADHGPSWSPDGRRIAFIRVTTALRSAIYTVNADGSGLRLVRRMPRKWPGSGTPNWSPDGSRLLFSTACRFGNCGQAPTGAQLFTIKPSGRGLRQLTQLAGNSNNGAWSPDGRKIVFVRNRGLGPTGDLYTINADGTRLRQLTHNPQLREGWPDWRPAMRRQA